MWRCGRWRGRGRLWRLRFEAADEGKCLGIRRGGGVRCLYRWRVRRAKARRLHTLVGWLAHGELAWDALKRAPTFIDPCLLGLLGVGEVLGGFLGCGVDFYKAVDFGHF